MLPGWYGFGTAVETWIAERPKQGMPFLQELNRMAVLPHAVVEHGHGAGQVDRDRLALRRMVPDVKLREKSSAASA